MNRLKQKLKSESGASILLAMLFFLICALVAAALLMAAVSNAGKIKSNQEMHQKYLAVSSALELVCEDLLSAEYRGQYTLSITDEKTEAGADIYTYNYTRIPGEYNCKLSRMLREELDAIFAEQMEKDAETLRNQASENEKIVVDPEKPSVPENATHTLTINAAGTDGVEMQEVKVFVTLDRRKYAIYLEARLVDDAAFGMEAELTPMATDVPHLTEKSANDIYKTNPMTWRLGWITKASKK